jgi:hypothetical protein
VIEKAQPVVNESLAITGMVKTGNETVATRLWGLDGRTIGIFGAAIALRGSILDA